MKILLIQPPIRDFYQTSIRTQPIGLAYLAAALQTHGYEVEILDCQTDKKKSISIPQELSYLKDFYPLNDRSPFKLYSGYYHFGMGWDEIRRRIVDSNADVFGISSNFTPYHGEALEVARIIKEWDRRKIVVMGGAHVSCDPVEVLRSPLVDYVVIGEGEIRFPLLLEQIKRGKIGEIDGMGYRANGKIQINPLETFIQNLDSLSTPARELFDLDRYRVRKKRSTMVITSRGCPHRCAYCSAHLVMGASFRKRTPEDILQEMVECRDRYGIEVFDIEDDNFTYDKERAKKLMKLIVQMFGERGIELTAMNGVSFASLDGELLRLMKRAGFKTINLSFVTTDFSLREKMKRPGLTIDFKDLLNRVEEVGLNVIAYAILGMPGQTIAEMVDTLIYLMAKRVLIGPSIYYPTPGTRLFKICKEMNILPPHSFQWRSSGLPVETKEFNRLDIVTLFRLARTINFIKGKMDAKEMNEGMTWKEIIQMLKERRKVRDEVKFNAQCDEKDSAEWINWFLLFFEERSFFGLRKNSMENSSFFKEKSSKKVLDYFFEKAWEEPILMSRND
jgi:anaerobic magnesium-protoporphyrin IX monomethyl ester cyclase